MDRNSDKLHTSGPMYLIPFGDNDKAEFFNLFQITPKEVTEMVVDITKKITTNSDFKLLTNNPIFWVFYCCIRYYTIKNDKKGLNTSLAIYALSNYPAVYSTSFKYDPNQGVMQYTMDHLSEKFLMKQAGHVFGGLFLSIQHSYSFLGPFMKDGSDKEVIRFIQRIRNDQKSMIKNICDQYMKNHEKGLRVKLSKDSFDEVVLDVDVENNTTTVDIVSDAIVNQIITNSLDLKRVGLCKNLVNTQRKYMTLFILSYFFIYMMIITVKKISIAVLFWYGHLNYLGKQTQTTKISLQLNLPLINGQKKPVFMQSLKEKQVV